MSEYQYYEFLAIDRPLTRAQIAEVREFSTRASITATSFINEYHWGDFRGNTDEFLKNYFDAMVYVANWGTHQFTFRVPKNLIDLKTVEPYCTDRILNVRPAGAYYIFDICHDEEGGEWEDGGGYMASLAGLRAEVIHGDYRPLFLAWLADLEAEVIPAGEPVPPIPPGLGKLTASQKSLVEFLGLDVQLVKMMDAAGEDRSASPAVDINAALARISVADKDAWLKELVEADDPHAVLRIKLKLEAAVQTRQTPVQNTNSRTAGELLERYTAHSRELDERVRQKKAADRRKAAENAAEARQRQLDQLAKNIPGAWRNIDQMIGLKSTEGYSQAIEAISDLRELSQRADGDPSQYQKQLEMRLAEHGRKQAFMRMVKAADLLVR
jgi:hypothetical protein